MEKLTPLQLLISQALREVASRVVEAPLQSSLALVVVKPDAASQ